MTIRHAPALLLTGLLAGLALSPAAQAQYRVVGPDGRVTYTDQPQAGAAGSRPVTAAAPASAQPALPAELRQAASRFPVVLYAAKDCTPCDNGRQLLVRRGIPFSEKRLSNQADQQALKQLSGGTMLPLLTIGQQQLKGLNTAEWTSMLDAAGYPAQSRLPANWPAPVATPLTAPTPAAPATPANPAEAATPAAPDTPQDPGRPKIRF